LSFYPSTWELKLYLRLFEHNKFFFGDWRVWRFLIFTKSVIRIGEGFKVSTVWLIMFLWLDSISAVETV
jgi:hypothetical protein